MRDFDKLEDRLSDIGPITGITIEELYLGIRAIMKEKKKVDEHRTSGPTTGSPKRVQKLNKAIKQYVETEGIFLRQGGDFNRTRTAELYLNRIPRILELFADVWEKIKVERSRSIVIAATQFMMELVCESYPHLLDALGGEGAKIELELIRSSELKRVVRYHEVDLAFGACLGDPNGTPDLEEYIQVNEILRENVGILANTSIPESIESNQKLADILNRHTLLVPPSGIVRGFADAIIKDCNVNYLNIREITDIWFGLAKLEHSIHNESCMFVLEGVLENNDRTKKLIDDNELKFSLIDPKIHSKSIVIGLFRNVYHEELPHRHPLIKIWNMDTSNFLP